MESYKIEDIRVREDLRSYLKIKNDIERKLKTKITKVIIHEPKIIRLNDD